MKSVIPNMLTALNLVFGVLSILSTYNGELQLAAFLIVAAMISDGLDGRVARFFNVSSEFGKELDSLCDLVSFGVAPAFLAYVFLLKEAGTTGYVVAAFFAVCGAMRLARFNVNTGTVKGYFMGLPIPAAGCAVATFTLMGFKPSGFIFPLMVAIFGYLMVSTVKYPDFKGKGEKIRLIPAIVALGAAGYILVMAKDAFLFVPFFAYAVFGIMNSLFGLMEGKAAS